MAFLNWLFSKPRFKRFEDAFTLTRDRMWEALRESLASPEHKDKTIWLVVHFMETFTQLQDRLESWNLEYDVVSSRLNPSEMDRKGLLNGSSIKLIISELIPQPAEIAAIVDETDTRKLALIVVERHPCWEEDKRLEDFAKSIPIMVEFGYYLALDDDVVKLAINDQTVEILKQLGLDDHELITSNMVTRRLEKVLKRLGSSFTGSTRADSASEWLLINGASESGL